MKLMNLSPSFASDLKEKNRSNFLTIKLAVKCRVNPLKPFSFKSLSPTGWVHTSLMGNAINLNGSFSSIAEVIFVRKTGAQSTF
jgi:hypothetical protein